MSDNMTEEEILFKKIKQLKEGYDKLHVIYEEVRDLVKSGYDGPFMGEEIRGLFYSYNEFEKWKKNNEQ